MDLHHVNSLFDQSAYQKKTKHAVSCIEIVYLNKIVAKRFLTIIRKMKYIRVSQESYSETIHSGQCPQHGDGKEF